MVRTDVLIVGAGPAGSMCAYLLKKAGVDCLLIDHATFPRDKICGGGLTYKTWHLLDQLMPGFRYDYNPVTRIRLSVDGKAQCTFDIEHPIRIVQRKLFDHALLQQYLALGGTFQQGALGQIEEQPDGSIAVTLKSGQCITCQYIVGADGSNSQVRRYLKPDTDRGILAMEQYMEKQDDCIEVLLSQSYDAGGYFYRFPNQSFDVVGFGDYTTTPEKFRRIMQENNIPEGKARGAYIYSSLDYPLHPHILLIGDAGGFANRITYEGIYNAFCTAQHAATAIITHRPFCDTNAPVFRRIRREETLCKLFYSPFSFTILRWMCHHPHLIKTIFDRKMRG